MAEPRFFRLQNAVDAEALSNQVDSARVPFWTDGITEHALGWMSHRDSQAVVVYGNGRHINIILETTDPALERTREELIAEGGWF